MASSVKLTNTLNAGNLSYTSFRTFDHRISLEVTLDEEYLTTMALENTSLTFGVVHFSIVAFVSGRMTGTTVSCATARANLKMVLK